MLYSRPLPVGAVTVTVALPDPAEQSKVCAGVAGAPGTASMVMLTDEGEVQPAAFVTV
jgi:hypothetical protein